MKCFNRERKSILAMKKIYEKEIRPCPLSIFLVGRVKLFGCSLNKPRNANLFQMRFTRDSFYLKLSTRAVEIPTSILRFKVRLSNKVNKHYPRVYIVEIISKQ